MKSKERNPVLPNPNIANAAFCAGMFDARGRGIERIEEACAAARSPMPQFRYEMAGLWTVFPFAMQAPAEKTGVVRLESRLESRLDSRLESIWGSALAAKIAVLLQMESLGKAAMAKALDHKSVSGELHKQVKRLLDQGAIEMTLPDKPNSRLQKYCLTAEGLSMMKRANKDGAQP